MKTDNLKVIGLFAGVGGIEKGFERAGVSTLVANELDKRACETYRLNHRHELVEGDVKQLSLNKISDVLKVSKDSISGQRLILAGGFPCQPFSVAGFRKGFDDERGNVYWEILRLISELQPEVIFLENVKNLETHDGGNTFQTILASLKGDKESPSGIRLQEPYFVHHKVLNSRDFGVPQNRERIYVVAFKNAQAAERFQFPKGEGGTPALAEFIDFERKVADKYYYTPERPFFDQLQEGVIETGVVYQWRRKYVRANKSGVSPTLTANMGMGGHNVPLVKTRFGIRKLTPSECFKLMGYPEIKLPAIASDGPLYKQAGNSVVVNVIEALAQEILTAISD